MGLGDVLVEPPVEGRLGRCEYCIRAMSAAVPAPAVRAPAVRFFRPSPTSLVNAGVAGWSSAVGSSPGPGATKVLHFVRHAQGFHNVDAEISKRPEGLDARLTDEGQRQCAVLAAQVGALMPDLIVSSPLTRTMQTTALCFGKQLAAGVPLIALESVRETVNYLCDARRPLSVIVDEVQAAGVNVDTSGCTHEHDELWAAYERQHGSQQAFGGHRESADLPAIAERARAAFAWLGARPEQEIVVVSHSAFYWNVLNMARVSRGAVPAIVDFGGDFELEGWLTARFENTEMRSVLCEFP